MKPHTRLLQATDRAVSAIRRTGWPIRIAAVLGIMAMLLLAAAQLLRDSTEELSSRAAALDQEARKTRNAPRVQDEATRLTKYAAEAGQYPDDLREVFQLADRFDVALLSAQYDAADRTAGSVVVRRVRLSARDDYPQIKLLLQAILSNAPHAYLGEIRLDRIGATEREVNAAFVLAFVYREQSAVSQNPPPDDRLP